MPSALPSSDISYSGNYKTKIISFDDADTFDAEIYGQRRTIRLSGVDAPEVSHRNIKDLKQLYNSGNTNPFAYTNKLYGQKYAKEATEFASKFINNQEVTLDLRNTDDYGRVLARIKNHEGKDLSKELIKAGLAHAYTSGRFVDREVWDDQEVRESFSKNVINRQGLYSNSEYIKPQDYKHGATPLFNNSYKQDLKVARQIQAQNRMSNKGITNEQFNPLFDNTESNNYLLLPSNLGSSYFHGVALHNQQMKQAGYNNFVTSGNNIGIAESLYSLSVVGAGKEVTNKGLAISRQYDKELYQQGLGNWFNENFALPQGMGRLYKDEVGFIPSLLGAFGAMLDKSYLYYTGSMNPYMELGQNYRDSIGYNPMEEPTGLFQATFEKGADFAISATSALGFYLVAGEPLSLIMSEAFRADTESGINALFDNGKGLKNNIVGTIFGGLKNNQLSIATAFGLEFIQHRNADDLKYAVFSKSQQLKNRGESFYSLSNFSFTPYHLNSIFFREKAGILLDNVFKPFALEYINPYIPGSEESNRFIGSIDNFIKEVRKPPDLEFRAIINTTYKSPSFDVAADGSRIFNGKFTDRRIRDANMIQSHVDDLDIAYKQTISKINDIDNKIKTKSNKLTKSNLPQAVRAKLDSELLELDTEKLGLRASADSLKEQLIKDKVNMMKTVSAHVTNVGRERQSIVAQKLQLMLEEIPLFSWRIFKGESNTTDFIRVGNIFSFDKASQMMQKILFSKGGVSDLVEQSKVGKLEVDIDGNERVVVNNIASIKSTVDTTVERIITKFKETFAKGDDLAKTTKRFRQVEKTLVKEGRAAWSSNGKTVHVTGDIKELLDATAEYDLSISKQTGGVISANQLVKAANASRDTSINKMTARINAGLGSELGFENVKSKSALAASAFMFGAILLNNLFQSTGGVSILTKVQQALVAGEEDLKMSVDFSGARLIDSGGMWQNATTTLITSAIILAGSTRIAKSFRDTGFKQYSLAEEAVESLLVKGQADSNGIYYRKDVIEGTNNTRYTLTKMQATSIEDIHTFRVASIEDAIASGHSVISTTTMTKYGSKGQQKVSGYVLDAGLQLIDNGNTGRNALIIGTIGLLAIGGAQSSLASVLNSSRNTTGTLDPLVGGTLGGLAVGLKYKSVFGGVLGFLGGSAASSLLNSVGLKAFSIGGKGDTINIQAQTALQLQNYSLLMRNKPDASLLEMQAGFYASEMSKMINIFDNKSGNKKVQVVAQQVPLPFVQFFLAKQIKGNTSSYSVGLQASPLTGMSYSVQLPVKITNEGGVFGMTYNEETNLLDIYKGANELAVGSFMALTLPRLATKQLAKGMRKLNFTNVAETFEDISEGFNTLSNVSRRVRSIFNDLVLNTATRTLGIVTTKYELANKLKDQLLRQQAPTEEALRLSATNKYKGFNHVDMISRHYLGKAVGASVIIGSVASIAYQMFAQNSGQDVNQTTNGLITATSMVVGGLGFATASYAKDLANINKVNKFKSVNQFANKLINKTLSKLPVNVIAKGNGVKRAFKRYGAVASTIGLLTYLATDSKFGISVNMDRKIKYQDADNLIPAYEKDGTTLVTEADNFNRFAIIGTAVGLGTGTFVHGARFGSGPKDTLEQYANLLQSRIDGKNRNLWQRHIGDRFLEKDAQYIIETANNQFKNVEDSESVLGKIRSRAEEIVDFVHTGAKPLQANVIHQTSGKNVASSVITSIRGTKDNEGLVSLLNETGEIRNKVAWKMGWRKLNRLTVPMVIVSTLAFAQLNRGGRDDSIVTEFLKDIDQGKANGELGATIIKPVVDLFRLVTGRDYADISVIDGKEFGRNGSVKKQGHHLLVVKDAQYNGFNQALSDIKSMFVFDNPNPFLSVGQVGMTLRPGDKGTRQSYYWQMQSAGQDISTSVYSMASSFAFKEMSAGAIQQALITDIALKGMSNNMSKETSISIAAKILNVSAQLQPLKKKRKYSRINDSVLELAGKDQILSMMLADREKKDQQMAMQPATSLFSQMIRDSVDTKRNNIESILSALSGSNNNSRAELMKLLSTDKFGNQTRSSNIKNLTIYGYNPKTGKVTGVSSSFDDESQFSTTATLSSTSNISKDNNPFAFLSYLWAPLSEGLPGVLGIGFIGGMTLGAIGWVLNLASRWSMREEMSIFDAQIEHGFRSGAWFEGQKGISFSIIPTILPDGTTISANPNSSPNVRNPINIEVVSGDTRFRANSKLISEGGSELLFRLQYVTNELAGQVGKVFDKGWGINGSSSFYSYMQGEGANSFSDDITKELDKLIKDPNGTPVNKIREVLQAKYTKQFETVADKMYGTINSDGTLNTSSAILASDKTRVEVTKGNFKYLYEFFGEEGDATAKLFNLRSTFIASITEEVDKILSSNILGATSSSATTKIATEQLIKSIYGASITTQMQRLTSDVLKGFLDGNTSKLLRNQLGGILQGENVSFVQKLKEKVESIANTFNGNKAVVNKIPSQLHNNISSISDVDADVDINEASNSLKALPDADIESPIIKRSYSSVKGKADILKGAFKLGQGLFFLQDLFTSVDILSSASRLGGAYSNEYATDRDIDLAKKEFGMITTNTLALGIGLGAASGVAIGAMTAIGATLGLPVVAVGAVSLIAAIATYKTIITPTMDALGKGPLKGFGKAFNKGYTALSDGVGEVLGGWVPEAVGSVFGSRGKSAAAMAVGGAVGGGALLLAAGSAGFLGAAAVGATASTGIVSSALAGIGLNIITGGTLSLFVGGGALVGAIAGLVAPKTTAGFMTNMSHAITSIPFIGSMLGTVPNKQLLQQDRFRKEWKGSPITFGSAKDVIQQEFNLLLNSSEDYTGKSTARLFIDDSLYGQSPITNAYMAAPSDDASRGGAAWAIIKPRSIITSDVQREVEVRAQNFNQAIVGNFNWRQRLRISDNYKAIVKHEEAYKNFKNQLAIKEAEKQVAFVKRLNPTVLSKDKIVDAKVLATAAYANAVADKIIEEEKLASSNKVATTITVNIKNVKNPSQENVEKDKKMLLKVEPNKKVITSTTANTENGKVISLKVKEEVDSQTKNIIKNVRKSKPTDMTIMQTLYPVNLN